MTHQDTERRQRADDYKVAPASSENMYPGADRRRSTAQDRRKSSGRSFLRRFRQPIIGLSLAGAAAPLINATSGPETHPTPTDAGATEAELARKAGAAASGADVEDNVAARIAAERGVSIRGTVVTSAMEKFGIEAGLAQDIYDAAHAEGIEPELAYGLVQTESSFKTRATSHVGARGLTQVMPRTAAWMVPGTKAEDLYDQKTNLKFGFRYLNQMIDKYRGNVKHALHAYNRGPGTVDRILKRGGDPANGYADKVMGGWRNN